MKHRTAQFVTALAWTIASPALAQQTPPPAPVPPPKPVEPAKPAAAPTSKPVPAPTTAPAPSAAPAPAAAPPAPAATLAPAAAAPATAPATSTPPSPPTAPAAPAAPATAAPAAPEATAEAPPSLPRTKKSKKAEEAAPPRPLLGLAVGAPETGALPGRIRPSYGVRPKSAGDYRFDFHGFLNVPFRLGLNERKDPLDTQYKTVFHGPPIAADERERFEHTGLIPEPWVQLGFSYGNSAAVATIIIAARSVSNASGFFNPPDQLGINDAFLTFKPDFGRGTNVEIDVGAFANRYGATGEYDSGRYDTPVIARVGGVGETLRINVDMADDLLFLAEHGVMGQWDRAPLGVEPAYWNDFADSNVGTSFAHHAHLGLALEKLGDVGIHYVNAWTRDDRAAPNQPDGGITVFGIDGEAKLAPYGRFYLGVGQTIAERARGVSGVVRVLNAFGGPGLMREYFGPDSGGTGTLTSVGTQYDVSIGEILRSPQPFFGYAPDILASAFGTFVHVTSEDPGHVDTLTGREVEYDGIDKLKYGLELTYSALSWFAGSVRYDRVIADISDDSRTLAAVSPRVIFRTDWNSQDQVTLQYTRWMYGSGVVARTGAARSDDPSVEPDADTFSLTASMWW